MFWHFQRLTVSDDELCSTSGYSIIRRDRNRRGGGVAVLISPSIRYRPRYDLSEGGIETLWLELFPDTKRSMLVCCAYRPTFQHNFYECLLSECEVTLTERARHTTIVGDLNSDPNYNRQNYFLACVRNCILMN